MNDIDIRRLDFTPLLVFRGVDPFAPENSKRVFRLAANDFVVNLMAPALRAHFAAEGLRVDAIELAGLDQRRQECAAKRPNANP